VTRPKNVRLARRPARKPPAIVPAALAAYLDRAAVAALLGVTPETVGDLVKRNRFPKPISLSRTLVRWRREVVEDFLRRLEKGGAA
jgi:predicted DNA-binding transcriptional regulator AlpA